MSELSQHAKLIKAIEIAKGAQVGIELSYFDVLEVAGELNEAKEVVAMLTARIAELKELLDTESQLSNQFYLLLVDNPKSKKLADDLIEALRINGKEVQK